MLCDWSVALRIRPSVAGRLSRSCTSTIPARKSSERIRVLYGPGCHGSARRSMLFSPSLLAPSTGSGREASRATRQDAKYQDMIWAQDIKKPSQNLDLGCKRVFFRPAASRKLDESTGFDVISAPCRIEKTRAFACKAGFGTTSSNF